MPPALVKHAASIELRPDKSLVLAVVADTHSAPHPASLGQLAALAPDAILHAGDIGDLEVLEALAEIAPLHAIRGNIDTRADQLPDVLTIDLTSGGHRVLRILVVHIGVYGPKLRGEVAKLAKQEAATLVVCGHSHVPFIGVDKGLTIFNPGSVGPRRFALPIVFGTIEVANGKLRLSHVDAETGTAWSPG